MLGYKKLSLDERREMLKQIVELHNAGKSIRKISKLLNVGGDTVRRFFAPSAKNQQRRGQFASLRNAAEKIMASQGLAPVVIEKNGLAIRRYHCSPATNAESREEKIISMIKAGNNFADIGRTLNLSREYIRQIARKLSKIHGPEILLPETKQYWTITEVTEISGISSWIVYRLCKNMEISSKRIGNPRCSKYLISQQGIDELYRYVRRISTCPICGSSFKQPRTSRRKSCFSPECQKKRRSNARKARLSDKKTICKNLNGWRKALYEALQSHAIPEDETWICFGKAVKISGLNRVQVTYLRECKLISVKPTEKKSWKGTPIHLYSLSEMQIAKEIINSL